MISIRPSRLSLSWPSYRLYNLARYTRTCSCSCLPETVSGRAFGRISRAVFLGYETQHFTSPWELLVIIMIGNRYKFTASMVSLSKRASKKHVLFIGCQNIKYVKPWFHMCWLRHIDLFHRGRISGIRWSHSHNQHFSRGGWRFQREQLQPFVPKLFLRECERDMELHGCTAVVRGKRFIRVRFDSQLDRLKRPCHHQPERKYRCEYHRQPYKLG